MDLREMQQQPAPRHPWERARLHHFRRVLAELGPRRGEPVRHLDVGSGDAWLANSLAADGAVSGRTVAWDIGYADPDVRRKVASQAPHVVLVDEAPDEKFDVVTLLDVLEHVEDAEAFLSAVVRDNLAPDGVILISVPAWSALYSEHDRALGHFRRYNPRAAQQLLAACGLRRVRGGGLFHSLLPARAATTLGERLSRVGPKQTPLAAMQWRAGKRVTTLVDTALRCDTAASRAFARTGLNVPGLSWWAICKTPA